MSIHNVPKWNIPQVHKDAFHVFMNQAEHGQAGLARVRHRQTGEEFTALVVYGENEDNPNMVTFFIIAIVTDHELYDIVR
jgi:hypothetical protein